MSYSFYVPAAEVPAADELLRRIDSTDLIVVDPALVAQWPHAALMLCRKLRSTRGVYLSYAEGDIQIKANVFSAQEDYQLALQLAVAAAEVAHSLPRGESSDPMPPDQLLAAHDEAWVRESHISALRVTRKIVEDRGTMSMPGPFQACHIGPRLLTQFGQAGEAAAIEGILDLMRRVQWIHTAGYEAASCFEIGESRQHLAIWFPAKRMFLPKVHWVSLGDIEPLLVFPFDRMEQVLGRPLTLIDECQPLIEPVTPEELPGLVARARQFHTSSLAAAPSPRVPWYKRLFKW